MVDGNHAVIDAQQTALVRDFVRNKKSKEKT
jgi:hypothetical protein